MKTMHRAGAVALALTLSVGLAACDFAGVTDAVDSFKLIIGLEEISTPVSVKFVDQTTGELVAASVELSFAGADADAVVDLFNDPLLSGKGTFHGGVAAFGIANDLTPSSSDPVQLRLTARAPGYEPQVKAIEITQEGRQSYIVRLAGEGRAPQGGSATRVQSGSADESGAVVQTISVSTPPTTETQGTASVSVPAGTVARTVDGRPLQGALTTKITYASASSRDALASLPGGFHAEIEGGSNGVLTTVGFAKVTLTDASNNVAKTFTQPIEIGLDIAPGTVNPLTGIEVAAGDALQVFSFDVDEGVWQREGSATVEHLDGRLRARLQATHLSTWSAGATVETCEATFNLTTNGNSVTSIKVWNSFYSETYSVPAAMQQEETLSITRQVPAGASLEYEIKGSTNLTGSIGNACDGATVSMPAAVQTAQITIHSSAAPCPSGQSLKAGYEGDYGVEVAEVVNGVADWESAQTLTVSVTTDGNDIHGSAAMTAKAGTEYRVQGSFNEEQITGGFSTPGSVAAGDVVLAEIDNEITQDISGEACE